MEKGTMEIDGADIVLTGAVDHRAPGEIRCMLKNHWSATGCVVSIEKTPYAWLFDPKSEWWKVPTELFAYESPRALLEDDFDRMVHVMISPTSITFVVPVNRPELHHLVMNIYAVLKLKGYIKKE